MNRAPNKLDIILLVQASTIKESEVLGRLVRTSLKTLKPVIDQYQTMRRIRGTLPCSVKDSIVDSEATHKYVFCI